MWYARIAEWHFPVRHTELKAEHIIPKSVCPQGCERCKFYVHFRRMWSFENAFCNLIYTSNSQGWQAGCQSYSRRENRKLASLNAKQRWCLHKWRLLKWTPFCRLSLGDCTKRLVCPAKSRLICRSMNLNLLQWLKEFALPLLRERLTVYLSRLENDRISRLVFSPYRDYEANKCRPWRASEKMIFQHMMACQMTFAINHKVDVQSRVAFGDKLNCQARPNRNAWDLPLFFGSSITVPFQL